MRVVRAPFPDRISSGSVVTIGKFDGVHLGHRANLAHTVALAAGLGIESAVVTFDRNPLAVLQPEASPPSLTGVERKLELLAGTGIAVTAVLTFDERRAAEAPEHFVSDLLVARLAAKAVLVGADFRFGADGSGDVELLRRMGDKLGFEVLLLPDFGGRGIDRISSSAIRALIADGEVAHAAALLGAPPAVTGKVVHGDARGRTIGYPTANLGPDAIGVVPADGVYAGWLRIDEPEADGARSQRMAAAISVSDNPTFAGERERRIEAFVIGRSGLDLYDREVTVEFVERIRGIEVFESVDSLLARMDTDVIASLRALGLG